MKPKRLVSDTKKLEQPQNTYPFGKNGVWNANEDALENEKGFRPSSAAWPYKYIGVIETDTYPVIFTTNNVNSAAGYWDIDKDIYTSIFNDSALAYKFNFNLDRPIKGEARRNYRNELELTWLELGEGANPPRALNTVRMGNDLNDFLLFPESKTPYIELTMQGGGNLGMGAYYIALKYIKNDGTETRYTTLTAPLIAVSDNWTTIPGGNTGKSLNITITGADTSYDRIGLVVVERINGVDTPYEIGEISIAATMTFIYTGSEKQTQLTLEEVIIPAAYYTNAKAITQLNDQLFLGNLDEEETIDWQKYANLVTVRWKSDLVTGVPKDNDAITGKTRGWMHEEVLCLYMVLKLKNGRNSRAFVLHGPAPISSDLDPAPLAAGQSLDGAKYQLQDTCRNIDTTNRTGDCGVWINQDEVYPNIDQFNSSDIGGEDLRGQKVRHFKMPTIDFCKRNFYDTDRSYGKTKLDVLGLEVSNVIIPPSLADKVLGWEIHYAKRDFNNATVLGQSLLLFGAKANSGGNIVSTGGNWHSYQRTHGHGAVTDAESLVAQNNYIRFHAFDLLNLRPSISPTHLSIQLNLVIRTSGTVVVYKNNQIVYALDYTGATADGSLSVPDDRRIRKVDTGQYLVDGQVSSGYANTRLEDTYVAHLPTPGVLMDSPDNWRWAKMDYDNGNNNTPDFEQSWLANLMTLRRNVYVSYYSQVLVRTGYVFPSAIQASDRTIYGGDTFISLYSFNTYGLVTALDVIDDTGREDWHTLSTDGYKVARSFVCESVADIAGRYEIPGNSYSKFFPKSPATDLQDYSRNTNPNQFGYTKDTNAVGDLLNGIKIASPLDDFVTRSPYKITRSVKQSREGKINSWKNFNALDYYETVKDKGEITNLQGYGDKLIIHHSDGFFVTRDKATLSADILKITLGTGDIFQFEPQEARPSKLGYAGTSNPLACVLTPAGYMFPDTRTGELFLFNGELINLTMGTSNFLKKYLTVKEINTFIGNGITLGYENYYNRLLITCKNKKLATVTNFVPGYEPTPEFFATLTPNVSVVYKDGRFQLFKGLNSSVYECTLNPLPILPDYNWSSPEHVPNGTLLGTILATGGTGPYNYIITTADKAGVALNSLNGRVTIQNSLAFDYTRSILHLAIKVTDSKGHTDTGVINITITQVDSTPVIPNYSVTIPEHTANATAVVDVNATDRDGKTIVYSILSGNSLGAFQINSATGVITVINSSVLDYETHPSFTLIVRATAGAKHADGSVIITLSYVFEPPVGVDSTFTISDSLATTALVGSFPAAVQASGDTSELIYELVSDSTPAAFTIELDPDSANFRKVTVLSNAALDPLNDNYVVTLKVYSATHPDSYDTFTVAVVVLYEKDLLTAERYQFSCLTGADEGTKHWLTGRIKTSRYGGRYVNTYNNTAGQVFQAGTAEAFPKPTFADEPDSPDCITAVACGVASSYSGGEAYPSLSNVTLGSGLGNVTLNADAISIPDKFEVWFDGVKVIDTGYRGQTSYQADLDAALAARGLPPETITAGGAVTQSFVKSTPTTKAIVKVYAPLPSTGWGFTLGCPVAYTPGTLDKSMFWDNSKASILPGNVTLEVFDNTNGAPIGYTTNPDDSDTDHTRDIHYLLIDDGGTVSYKFTNHNATVYADVQISTTGYAPATHRILPGGTFTFSDVPKLNLLVAILST